MKFKQLLNEADIRKNIIKFKQLLNEADIRKNISSGEITVNINIITNIGYDIFSLYDTGSGKYKGTRMLLNFDKENIKKQIVESVNKQLENIFDDSDFGSINDFSLNGMDGLLPYKYETKIK